MASSKKVAKPFTITMDEENKTQEGQEGSETSTGEGEQAAYR